jgi:AcrR family transcriptional regulator
MKTRDWILDTAHAQFNQHGIGTVSTNHIAEAVGISPGNLYYHFRNKEEIIRALFERLFDAWDTRLNLSSDRPPILEDVKQLVQINFEIMWQYRFVYREILALLQQDSILHERYITIRKRGYQGFQEMFAILAPDSDELTVRRMADLCWLISEYWLPTLETKGQTISQQHMQDGIDLMIAVLQPYIPT